MLVFNRGGSLAVPVAIGGGGSLVQAGSGTVTLSGANTYTGTTTLAAGVLNLGIAENAGASGPLGQSPANNPGSIVLNGGFLQCSAVNKNDYSGRFSTAINQAYNVDTNGQNATWATPLISLGGTLDKAGSGLLTLTGNNTYNGGTTVNGGTLAIGGGGQLGGGTYAANITLTASSATFAYSSSAAQTLSGVIGGSGSLTEQGPGTLTLANTGNYSGGTIVAGGQLLLGGVDVLPAGGPVITTGGTLNLGGLSQDATGTLSFRGGTVTGGTINNIGAAYDAQAGTITAVLAGTAGLTKSNAGTLTLANTASYGGPTLVAGGLLAVTGPNTLPSANPFTFTAGTLNLGGFSQNASSTVSFQGGTLTGGTLNNVGGNNYDAQAGNVSAVLAGNVALAKTTSGVFILTNSNNAYTGGNTINAGTLGFANGALPGTIAFTNNSTLQWAAGNTQDVSPQIQSIPGGVTATLDTQANVVSLSGSLSGAGGINKVGNGMLTLANSGNSYGGGTTLTAGTVSISSLADLGSGSLNFNGGVLQITGTALASLDTATYNYGSFNGGFDVPAGNTFFVNQNLSGTGSLTKTDGGTLVLVGTNSLGGTTTVSGGALLYASTSAISSLGMRNLTVANGAVVGTQYPVNQALLQQIATGSLGNSFVVALASPSSNPLDFSSTTGGSLSMASLGAVGNQTYSGTFIPSGGTAGSYRLGGGGGSLTFLPAAAITGSSTVTITGPGTVVLATSNNYTGATTISSGVAQLANQAGIPDNTALTLGAGTLDLGGFNKAFTQAANFSNAAGAITNSGITGLTNTMSLTSSGAT